MAETAFQADAFQVNAFQIGDDAPVVSVQLSGGSEGTRRGPPLNDDDEVLLVILSAWSAIGRTRH